jgi:hypothetical protein
MDTRNGSTTACTPTADPAASPTPPTPEPAGYRGLLDRFDAFLDPDEDENSAKRRG